MGMKTTVIFDKVKRVLPKLPYFVLRKLQKWARDVELLGISEIRKIPGYHDEPLYGLRKGQRSIRLNLAYRAIYEETEHNKIKIISIVEVNKHEY